MATFRRGAGLSQEEVAHRSGLDRTTISQLERGVISPRLETMIRLAGALDIRTAELIPPLRWRPPTDAPPPVGRIVVED